MTTTSRSRTRAGSRPRKVKEKAPPSVAVMIFGFVTFVAYVVSLLYSLVSASAEVWGALLLLPVIVGITMPLCNAAARHQHEPRLARLLTVALVLKMMGACVRYAIAFNVYSGEADAKAYDHAGRILAAGFRAGHFDFGHGAISDTHFIEVLTGFVYTVIGNTQLGGFFVFSWFGFLGLYLFYRAFVIAVPDGNHRRYALLLFFLPSLLFWSSSIGKEAWMTLVLGAVAYGAARAYTRQRGAFIFIALGVWGANAVRPHMALLILAGVTPAYALRGAQKSLEKRRQSLKIIGVAALVAGIVFTVGRVEQKFGLSTINSTDTNQVLNDTQTQTTQGGSSFTPTRVHSPIQLPMAIVTVIFRPFPNEAHTTQGFTSALEGTFLLVLTLLSFKRLRRIPKVMITTPYVTFAVIYILVFVWAFSTIANFGILVRQRVQVYPMFLVLLALPKPAVVRPGSRARLHRSYAAR